MSRIKDATAAYVRKLDKDIEASRFELDESLERRATLDKFALAHRDLGPAWIRRITLQLMHGVTLSPADAAALARLLIANFIDGKGTLDAIAPKGRPDACPFTLDDVFNARADAGGINPALKQIAKQHGMTYPAAKQAYHRAHRAAVAQAVKDLRNGRGVEPLDDAALEAITARYSDIFSPEDHKKRRFHIIGWNDIARKAKKILNKGSA